MQGYPAPAKLNLFLHVVGRRPDGYHLLQTVFRFIDYGDVVHLGVRNDGQIVRLHELAGVPEDRDLTVRAARLLQAESGTARGADILLEKRLPQGGGLGGGSSDAATVLLALNRLWRLNWPRRRLQELAVTLGADVPVFVFGQAAFAGGIGDILQPVSLQPAWYVVLTPPIGVSTAQVFAAPELTRDTPPIKITDFSAGVGRNDLLPIVLSRSREVAKHLNWLKAFGDARLTGSGACVFLEVPDRAAGQTVLAQLPSDMQGFIAAGLDRHVLYDLAA
ncbi:MAG: 4-(cytidine 5'-diphospho)-2-C-methyl-D-erythritol kinase [Thiobacillaceae bacterium]